MARARLPGTRATAADTRLAVDLYHQGYPVAAIAIRFGRCVDWVRTQVALRAADSSTNAVPRPASTIAMTPSSL